MGLVGGEFALQGQAYITGYGYIGHLEAQGDFNEIQKVRLLTTLTEASCMRSRRRDL
jgi:hypothetical protein